ncbi:hypothetical protein EMIT0P176_100123 [Pseudomonas sp. IT-P176]
MARLGVGPAWINSCIRTTGPRWPGLTITVGFHALQVRWVNLRRPRAILVDHPQVTQHYASRSASFSCHSLRVNLRVGNPFDLDLPRPHRRPEAGAIASGRTIGNGLAGGPRQSRRRLQAAPAITRRWRDACAADRCVVRQ